MVTTEAAEGGSVITRLMRPSSALRERYVRALLLLPALLFLAAFFIYPVLRMLRQSIQDGDGWTLDHYRWFFGTPFNVTVLRRTFVTAGLVTTLCVVVAFPYAYLMTVVGSRWRAVLLALVLLPFWTSLIARNIAWLALLQPNGPVSAVMEKFGLGDETLLRNVKGVVMAMAQILLPFMVLPLYANLRTIDRRLLDAADGLGARPIVAFVRVYLPLAIPGLIAGSLLVFILSLGFFLTPAIIGSPQNSLLSQLIVTQVSGLLNWGRAGAMATVLLGATVVLLGLAGLVTRRSRSRLGGGW